MNVEFKGMVSESEGKRHMAVQQRDRGGGGGGGGGCIFTVYTLITLAIIGEYQ